MIAFEDGAGFCEVGCILLLMMMMMMKREFLIENLWTPLLIGHMGFV